MSIFELSFSWTISFAMSKSRGFRLNNFKKLIIFCAYKQRSETFSDAYFSFCHEFGELTKLILTTTRARVFRVKDFQPPVTRFESTTCIAGKMLWCFGGICHVFMHNLSQDFIYSVCYKLFRIFRLVFTKEICKFSLQSRFSFIRSSFKLCVSTIS